MEGHLELQIGDTVLVRLGNKKIPERDHFLVTNVRGNEITASNKKTGQTLRRHLSRFIKIKERLENPAEQDVSDRQEEKEDVLIELPVDMPPGRAPPPRDVEQNVREDRVRRNGHDEDLEDQRRLVPPRYAHGAVREDRARGDARNDEDDRRQSPRTTRQKTRETGVPPPNLSNVQSSTLERSVRERATTTQLLDQYRRDTNAVLEQQRQQLLRQRDLD